MERGISQRLDAEKQALERTNRELRSKITELESATQSRSRAQIAALEARIQNLTEQNNAESSERASAERMVRRLEKRLAEAMVQVETERRNTEQCKEQVIIFF